MAIFLAAGLALSAAQMGMGLAGAKKQEKAAAKAAEEQANLTGLQRSEEIRQRERVDAYEQGSAVAAIGASNLQFSGSPMRYSRALNSEAMRARAHDRRAAELEQRAIMAGAQGAGDSLRNQSIGNFLSSALSYGQDIHSHYQNRSTPDG